MTSNRLKGTFKASFLPALFIFGMLAIVINEIFSAKPPTRKSRIKKLQVQVDENEDLVKWKSILDIWDKEADRFWARSNVFLLVNGALLVAITSFSSERLLSMIISIFGMIFVSLWIRVNRMGKYYLDRWKELLNQLEEGWTRKIVSQLPAIAEGNEIARKYKASTTYMLYVVRLIFLLWVFLFFYEIIAFLNAEPELVSRILCWLRNWFAYLIGF